jgi:hypothetical protein
MSTDEQEGVFKKILTTLSMIDFPWKKFVPGISLCIFSIDPSEFPFYAPIDKIF